MSKKLSLNKETLRHLNAEETAMIAAGSHPVPITCPNTVCTSRCPLGGIDFTRLTDPVIFNPNVVIFYPAGY